MSAAARERRIIESLVETEFNKIIRAWAGVGFSTMRCYEEMEYKDRISCRSRRQRYTDLLYSLLLGYCFRLWRSPLRRLAAECARPESIAAANHCRALRSAAAALTRTNMRRSR